MSRFRQTLPHPLRGSALLFTAVCAMACAGTRPTDLGVSGGMLRACPSSPNCVSETLLTLVALAAVMKTPAPAPAAVG